MQKRLKTIATLAAAAFAAVGGAAPIPQEWAVEVSRVRQYQFQATHGDTMELKATFWHDGEPFDLGGEPFLLYWQTNAMESIYWSAPATASSNTVSAVFANTMDPGAPIVYGFLGATSGNYRASFSIRFAPGPGAVPNELPLPAATIDFAKVEVLNPPYATKEGLAVAASSATNYTDSVAQGLRDDIASAAKSATNYTDSAIAAANVVTPSMVTNIVIDVAPQPGNYAAVSNAAINAAITNALQDAAIAGKASKADATLTPIYSQAPTFSEWTYSQFPDGWQFFGEPVYVDGKWFMGISNYQGETGAESSGDEYATVLAFDFREYVGDVPNAVITASRRRTDIIGYTLGSQSDKPLQPAGDYALAGDITNTVTKTYVKSLGISASDVGATTPADVTVMIRDQSLGGIWDQDLEVWWTPVMANGSLTYQATTNVNLNAGH